jgi:hypothetical protein
MNYSEFKNSFLSKQPPAALPILLKALWFDAKGDWESAHNIAQQKEGNMNYDRIHAYLHRKEGDTFNAKYWYNRAKTNFPSSTLDQEWEYLVNLHLD